SADGVAGGRSGDLAACAPETTLSTASSRRERRRRTIAPPGCRQLRRRRRPSIEGRADGQDERVLAGPADELRRGGQAVLGGSAGERERRPAEGVEGEGMTGLPVAVRVRDDAHGRRDEGEGRGQEEVEAREQLEALLAVELALARRGLRLALRDREALLELLAHVLAV